MFHGANLALNITISPSFDALIKQPNLIRARPGPVLYFILYSNVQLFPVYSKYFVV